MYSIFFVNYRLLLLALSCTVPFACEAMSRGKRFARVLTASEYEFALLKNLMVEVCPEGCVQTFQRFNEAQQFNHYTRHDLQDLFAQEIVQETEIGKRVEPFFHYGQEIPSRILCEINKLLPKYIGAGENPYVWLDSFPSDYADDAHLRALKALEEAGIVSEVVVSRGDSLASLEIEIYCRDHAKPSEKIP